MRVKKIIFLLSLSIILPLVSSAQNLFNNPESVAYDSLHYRYLVSNIGNGAIIQVDSMGVQDYFKTGLGQCYGNCVVGDTFFVSVNETHLLGINLTTEEIIIEMTFTGVSNNFDGMTYGHDGYLYVVDTGGKIYKVNIADQTYTIFVNSGLANYTQDIIYDLSHNRLLAIGYTYHAPIQAISLEDSSVSDVVVTTAGYYDGITIDPYFNVYLAAYLGDGGVYRYDSTFTNPPDLISTPHNDPAGLDYNHIDDVLAVPNFTGSTVDFIPMFVPVFSIDGCFLIDNGNGDGRADPGETCQLFVALNNSVFGEPATNVTGELLCSDPAVEITNNNGTFGDIQPGVSSMNSLNPYIFSVSECEPHFTDFTVIVTCDQVTQVLSFDLELSRPDVLLVDDDGGDDHEQYYLTSFGLLDMFVDVWDESETTISAEELLKYGAVIWQIANERATLTAAEQSSLQGFLDGGGNLLITSTNLGADVGGTGFYTDYLHAEFTDDTVSSVVTVFGTEECPFTDPAYSLFFVGGTGAGNFQSLDAIEPVGGAGIAFTYNNANMDGAGIFYDDEYKLVYLAFPLETVTGLSGSVPREIVISDILNWFECLAAGSIYENAQPVEFRLNSCYPNPFNSSTEIEYELPLKSNVSLTIYDVLGRKVSTLVEGVLPAGFHEIVWDADMMPSGIYFCHFKSDDNNDIIKMVLMK